ncbi:MAG: RNA 2',3'-cyclic phosphodiesterase [Alphaproteobacteria bacterium]|nr:RNA 2',3'-cyclic phosphodiesterase [Alphaproteobacteria bacterium]
MNARLFLGITLPPSLCKQLANLPELPAHCKPTAPHNYHLTLAFIGEVDRDLIDIIHPAMADINAFDFPLAVRGLGRFDHRILWAGLTSHSHLHDLHQRILSALDAAHIPFDFKPYKPHITLARLRNSVDKEAVEAYITANADLQSSSFMVEQFHLYESVSTAHGVQYTPIASYELKHI